jgi:hypothetical protein
MDLKIRAVLIPSQERLDRKAVVEVLHPRAATTPVANSDRVKKLRKSSAETDAGIRAASPWQIRGALGRQSTPARRRASR